MKKIVYLMLAASMGLNLGFVGAKLAGSPDDRDRPRPQQRPPHPPRSPEALNEEHVRGMTQHLNLTPEQQARIRESLLPQVTRLLELRRQMHAVETEISSAFAAPRLDRDDFWRAVRQRSAGRARVDSLAAVMLLTEASVLTPEQRARYAEVAPVIHVDPGRVPPPGRERR